MNLYNNQNVAWSSKEGGGSSYPQKYLGFKQAFKMIIERTD